MALVQDRVVVITGASRGIGRSCAQEFAKHGATGFLLHYYGDAATSGNNNLSTSPHAWGTDILIADIAAAPSIVVFSSYGSACASCT
ncbi:hypothetical protein C8J55DRAFT_508968 [Lentinula edodes]|uniref:NAD(P)-binding protein n=1 Tax=Lentinula lateritia TaxID=40482 RepID=A0A9W9AM17_9AGAR|nr:hypothetical protein C8J55DRAFT_508968 [Lentinula edodes]